MNKNMRTRNLDPSKPMTIYDSTRDDLPDRIEPGIVRTLNSLPTGMEKDEELEHHLQLAMVAAAKYGDTKMVAIPIPDVVQVEAEWCQKLYPDGYAKNVDLYRVQGLSAGPEPDTVDYCIDEADDEWLKKTGSSMGISVDRFETAIDRLEKSTGFKIPTESDAAKILKDRADIVSAVYGHWLAKRNKLHHPLMLRVRTENKRDTSSGHDPYVAFRRRAEKMQTRKNRKSDELNYVVMYKMKIAHSNAMKDGLMDIITGVRQRETLKLRTTLTERHEFNLSHCVFDDAAGDHYVHILENYPELSRIDAETNDDLELEESDDDEYGTGDSGDDMSDIPDSDSVATSSWSDLHPASRGERARSLRYELDDVNLKDFPAPLVIDPNLVSESQYRGEEPPEYWGNDGEFTFVPRKDCQYLQVKDECDTVEEPDDPLRGFFLHEIPVIIGGHIVMKTVLARRSYGLSGVRTLDYYEFPHYLDGLIDLSNPKDACDMFEHPEWNVFQLFKERIYAYSPDEAKVASLSEPDREPLADSLLEEIYQFALKWKPSPSEMDQSSVEDFSHYQIACSSICQPLLEHNYCQTTAPYDAEWFTPNGNDAPDLDLEDLQNLAAAQELVAGAGGTDNSQLEASSSKPPGDATPSTPAQSDVESVLSMLTGDSSSHGTGRKRKAPAAPKPPKKAKVPLAELRPSATQKRPRQPNSTDSVKPAKKKTKPTGLVESVLENRNGMISPNAVLSMPPEAVPLTAASVITGIIKNAPVKRKPPAKKAQPTMKPEPLLNGGSKKKNPPPKHTKEEEIPFLPPLPIPSTSSQVYPTVKAPQRAILSLPLQTPVTMPSSCLTNPSNIIKPSTSGGRGANPNLQALLSNTAAGVHSTQFHTAGTSVSASNGIGLAWIAQPSKMC